MKPIKSSYLSLIIAFLLSISVSAQSKIKFFAKKEKLSEIQLKRWSHLDLEKDSIPGMSVDKAYAKLLKGKKGIKVIVGVVDSGIDIEHEDLKSMIWTNKKEIPENGIDDDKNGFIDDIHGWNFLGNSRNENLEMTRIVKKGDDGSAIYKKAKQEYEEKYNEALDNKETVDLIFQANKKISEYLNKTDYTLQEVESITTVSPFLNRNKQVMMGIIDQFGTDFNEKLEEYKVQVYDELNYNLNLEFDGRKIVGDNPDDLNDTKYGNNNVSGPDKDESLHGTHVAGIIAQVRDNAIGGDGIANNAEIMPIRAVPNGDEYDKDIALAIRYAADNGAKVINGSFGKGFSPHKQWVYDAIKYAEKKDVLFVIGVGNDGENIDLEKNANFPNDSQDNKKEFASNVLAIGALNTTYGEAVIADYSNYGNFNVDVFAPGSEIYSTVPNNKYKFEQGTSMASPNVAGVAALIRSYYPKLSAAKVKQIIINSGTPLPVIVQLGKSQEKNSSSNSSKSKKMVNAYNALLMAEKWNKKR